MISGISPLDKLFTNALRQGSAAGAAAPSAIDFGASLASAIGNAAENTIAKLESADKLSIKALQGEVPAREVVDAVMSAEQALQTSIAIRDKIVSAYLEISRMSI